MFGAVYVLDRDARIVRVEQSDFPALNEAGQHNARIFEAFPGVREAGLGDLFDRAWHEGTVSRVFEYAGAVNWVCVNRYLDGDTDTVTVVVQALPMDGLHETITRLCDATGRPVAA